MSKELPKELIVDELLKEVRSLHKQLSAIRAELNKCPDMDRMSSPGAVRSLVNSKAVLLEVVQTFTSANRNRTQPERLLAKLDELLNKLT